MKRRVSYRIIPVNHTADLAFRIRASSLPDLFAGAVHSLFRSFIDLRRVPQKIRKTFTLKAGNIHELLFLCLKTLLDHYFSTGFAVRKTEKIRILGKKHAEISLLGDMPGKDGLNEGNFLKREIKGITCHQMEIRRKGKIFSVLIVIDV